MKVAVIMGGTSFEREFSLESGERIARELEAKGHTVVPLDATEALTSTLRAEVPDVAVIAVHGLGGEDGTIQELLDFLLIPYVGSTSKSCRASWNKVDLKREFDNYMFANTDLDADDLNELAGIAEDNEDREEALKQIGELVIRATEECLESEGPDGGMPDIPVIVTPTTLCLTEVAFRSMGAANALDLVEARLGYPVAVKPACGGSALGVSRVERQEDLGEAIMGALSFDDKVLIQEWIEGVELAVGVYCNEDDIPTCLAPVEIAPKEEFFTTASRLDPDAVDYYAPVRDESLKAEGHGRDADVVGLSVCQTALDVFEALGCRDLVRVDMILSDDLVYVIDVKVAPGMSENSLVPMAVAASGLDLGDLLDGLVREAAARGV